MGHFYIHLLTHKQSYPPAISTITSGTITITETTPPPLTQESKSCAQEDGQRTTADEHQAEDPFQTPLEDAVKESLKQLNIEDGRNTPEIIEKPTVDTQEVMSHDQAIMDEERKDTDAENVAKASENITNVTIPPAIQDQETVLLDRVQSDAHLTKILIDLLHR